MRILLYTGQRGKIVLKAATSNTLLANKRNTFRMEKIKFIYISRSKSHMQHSTTKVLCA